MPKCLCELPVVRDGLSVPNVTQKRLITHSSIPGYVIIRKTMEMIFACKKCKKVFRKDMEYFLYIFISQELRRVWRVLSSLRQPLRHRSKDQGSENGTAYVLITRVLRLKVRIPESWETLDRSKSTWMRMIWWLMCLVNYYVVITWTSFCSLIF
jgi:hypothetical protein